MKFATCSAMVLALAAAAAAQPTIRSGVDGVVNNASYAPRGLPNSSIAQGSIFAIFGSNLGPAALAQQPSYPLQTTLGGTSVKVTVGGTSVAAIPIYTVAGQVGAVLPSNTPTGDGTVTVTYNGATSSSHAITVVPSSVGIFTLNQAGTGPAVITDANYNVITINNSAKPGQALIIWGTGVGPISGSDAAQPNPTNLTGIPIKVYIGTALAPVTYAGRSGCCSGLDQIIVTVPSGLSGCYVSLVVVTNNSVASNSATLPVAPNGGACSDPNGVGSSDLTGLLGKSSINLGYLSLGRSTTQTPGITVPGVGTIGGTTTKSDSADGVFYRYTPQQLLYSQGLVQQTSIGSCVVFRYLGSTASQTDPVLPVPLDAGATITLTGGTSTQTLTRNATLGFYTTPTSTNPLQFIPDQGGTFTFNGSGGADVGAISNAIITLGAPIVWTNMDSITNVQRTSDLLITWSGGNAGTYVQITGGSILLNGTDTSSAQFVGFVCEAPTSDGKFSVPSAVLLQLPPSSGASVGGVAIPTGSLAVGNYVNPVKFTAPGLDLGYVDAYVTNGKAVAYQ